jgi:DNA-directed RNA polymerase specialized sigma24 family protein
VLYQAEFEVQEEQADYVHEEQTIEEFALEQDRLFYKNLMKLPGECIRILQLYCLKISYKEIARLLKYKDDVYVKTRKYSCKQLLRKKIINDPECHHLVKRHGK